MSTLRYFFRWYDGAIWSNLIASAIWATPAIFFGRRKLNKMHKHIKEIHAKVHDGPAIT